MAIGEEANKHRKYINASKGLRSGPGNSLLLKCRHSESKGQ
jgi:hypothetical protein